MKKTSNNLLSNKIKILSIIFLTLSFAIIARLIILQFIKTSALTKQSQQNFTRIEKIYSPRGKILDWKEKPLATNIPTIALCWQGTGNKKLSPEQLDLINQIEGILSKNLMEQNLKQVEQRKQTIILSQNIGFDVLRHFIEQYPDHPNLKFETSFKRNYPYKTLACHILGYLGSKTTLSTGIMGLEKICDNKLQGIPGTIKKEVNSKGIQIKQEELEKATQGNSLKITLDLETQKIAEATFWREYSGTLIVMNPQNGNIKAILSRPAFDPNLFTQRIAQEKWTELQKQNKSFLNRAFIALYPPASLFKLVTITAALETNLITQENIWQCDGHTIFGNRKYRCNKKDGHGEIATKDAISLSCNIPFFEIGKKIDINTLAKYAKIFGLGQKTNKVFPEKSGLIPTREWKELTKEEPWWQGETVSAAIGQSYLLVTPIQMARMIAAIIEGYLVTPSIIDKEIKTKKFKKLQIKESTREFLKECMLKVAEEGGTGERLSQIPHIDPKDLIIYAKTGTAQTVSQKTKNTQNKAHQNHAWVITYVKYKDYEPFVLLILLEHAGTSKRAAIVAKNFIKRWMNQQK